MSLSRFVPRVVALAHRRPASKRLLWRWWYQFLAARYRHPDWTFMNYGFRATDRTPPRELEPADEPDRSLIQLYDTVACATPLAGRDVLEVGCGRGGGASFLARYHGPRSLVAVDLAPRAVALCRARFSVPGLSFEVGDAERLPFAAGAFDAVVNVESSHCYGRIDAFFREARRVLRPGGAFLYADFARARRSPVGGRPLPTPASASMPSATSRRASSRRSTPTTTASAP